MTQALVFLLFKLLIYHCLHVSHYIVLYKEEKNKRENNTREDLSYITVTRLTPSQRHYAILLKMQLRSSFPSPCTENTASRHCMITNFKIYSNFLSVLYTMSTLLGSNSDQIRTPCSLFNTVSQINILTI